MQETWVWSLGWDDPLEQEMETLSSILAWRIPWTEDLADYKRIGHNLVTKQPQYIVHSSDSPHQNLEQGKDA